MMHSGADDGQVFFTSRLHHVVPHMVAALDRAYRDACDNYGGSPGANETTFGTDVYHFACHYLVALGADDSDLVQEPLAAPKFRMRAGSYLLACHRVGQHAGQDILACTPRAPGAGTMSEPLQMKLFDDTVDVRALESVRRLVLAHLGNAEEGLCAVYLCVAASGAEDEKIKGWSHTELLWKRSGPKEDWLSPGLPTAPSGPLPPEPEADAEPRLRPTKKKKDDDAR